MKHVLVRLALLATAVAATSSGAMAQAQPQDIPGGATGKTVYCLQAGDLKTGAFVGAYLQTAAGAWDERLKAGTFKLAERSRDDLILELFDSGRSASVQFDFVNRTVKYKAGSGQWVDRYYILNATDQAGSKDCAFVASLSGGDNGAGAGGAGGPRAGGGGGGGGPRGGGGGGGGGGNASRPVHPTTVFVLPPGTKLDIAPGTQFTATAGPPCPGRPGEFLCPNKFQCAPLGGVCCPGVGACGQGLFCDQFILGSCIAPGDARFCPGTANAPGLGLAVHCAPGLTCVGGNMCQ
jgi:hypothetical protein